MKSALVVAIDGPAGAGKSTVARKVAIETGLPLVDTGAIYRTVAWVAKRRGVSFDDAPRLAQLARALPLRFVMEGAENQVWLVSDGRDEDISTQIRTPEMSLGASAVGRHPEVRQALLELQRRLGERGAVLEGRDIGTVVFPDAPVKVFLTASAEERARRRAEELAERGVAEPYEKVLEEIVLRDRQDTERDIAPLRPADDAWLLDSTALTTVEVVARISARVQAVGASR